MTNVAHRGSGSGGAQPGMTFVRMPCMTTVSSPAAFAAPRILGIVNITADSFSDGGRYLAPAQAIAHARALIADGADIVDLGPAASNPDAATVAPAEEIRRLGPVLDALAPSGVALSVDSCRGETQRFALTRDVAYLNDIQGFADPTMYPLLAPASCKLIVMHAIQRGHKADRSDSDAGTVLARIGDFFANRVAALVAAGIARDRIILDPGMGFFLGSAAESSYTVLHRLGEIKRDFGLPLLVSVSRKSFLRALTGRSAADSGAATLAAEIHAALQGADYIRTHDVRALKDALRVFAAIYANR